MAAEGVERRSLSSRFNVNTQTGGVSCTIPIKTSPGRSGFGPELSLHYNSGSAGTNGPFGLGWSMDGVEYITRSTTRGVPRYDEDASGGSGGDIFVHSRLGDLVRLNQDEVTLGEYSVCKYRPRFEAEPVLIQRWTKGRDSFWKTISADNVATVFGRQSTEQILYQGGPQEPNRVFTWLASEAWDSHGNHIKYKYKAENTTDTSGELYELHRTQAPAQKYLKSVQYGNVTPSRDLKQWDLVVLPSQWLFEVVFDYGEHDMEAPATHEDRAWTLRPDPFSTYSSGFEIRTYRRCRRVLMFHHFLSELGRQDCLVSSTTFSYSTETHSGATLLRSCTQNGHIARTKSGYWTMSEPPTEFVYNTVAELDELPVETVDLSTSGITSGVAQWIDLDGEGAPGILTKGNGGAWYYQRNISQPQGAPEFGAPRLVTTMPNVSETSSWSFEDVCLDGVPAVVMASDKNGLHGYYEREEDGGWLNFVPFELYPNVTDSKSNVRLDLNGDGRTDLLDLSPTPGGELTWHPSQGHLGFAAARRTLGAPVLPSQDPKSSVQLVDMTGDSLNDIVEIRNGRVCYWPNMGHGRFGKPVVMGNSPVFAADDAFLPGCIRARDLTGSGTTDLVYLHPRGGATVYYNRCGNSWSEGYAVRSFPSLDHTSLVDVLDLRGLGTPCLCWMSDLRRNSSNGLATVRFIDLMAKKRPGLLAKWSNGTGSETTFAYKSSFAFYRDDDLQGKPWTTKLPFPIQCVAETVTVDRISQSSRTTRYAFHNGFYDQKDRQFRGFQLVDTWDVQQLQSAASGFDQPPILTRTWFHTGLRRLDESASLPQSFRVQGERHADLPGSTITTNQVEQTAGAAEEAYRALAGRERRSEVYSVDVSDERSPLPFVVTQKRYEVVVSRGSSTRYTTRVNDREELSAHYERLAKPGSAPLQLAADEGKIEQHLILETDAFGNILLEVSVKYGKMASTLVSAKDRAAQEETVVTYTETSYTKAHETHDYFQIPSVALVQEYRVFPTKTIHPGDGRYDWETVAKHDAAFVKGATEMPIEEASGYRTQIDSGLNGLRTLLSKKLILYTSGDLKTPLDPKTSEPFSIPYQTYQLAFTEKLLDRALERARPATVSAESRVETLHQGGYVEYPVGSGDWWTASGLKVFGDNTPASRLDTARRQFYITDGEIDAYGNKSPVKLDAYSLLVSGSTDAVGSMITKANSYASLQPLMVTDANLNRVQSCYDPLGRLLGIAMLGKKTKPPGNDLDGLQETTTDLSLLEDFFRDPVQYAAAVLSNASKRTIYALDRFYETSKAGSDVLAEPGCIVQLTRHDHVGEGQVVAGESNSRQGQISIEFRYVNGVGDIMQVARLSRDAVATPGAGSAVWDFSGWVLNDSKGKPIQKFHPFQAQSHKFRQNAWEDSHLAETLLRDPLDRVVGSIKADHSWTKTRFTPWTQVSFDEGSTVMISDPTQDADVGRYIQRLDKALYSPTWYDQRTLGRSSTAESLSAVRSEAYASVRSTSHQDALGRVILRETGTDKSLRTSRSRYSCRGEVVEVLDTMGRVVDTIVHDLLKRPLYKKNMDSGERWALTDSQGQQFLVWSGRSLRKRITYDALRRVDGVFLLSGPDAKPSSEIRVVKKVYGEAAKDAAERNLVGQQYQCFDQAGLSTNSSFDVLGGCTASSVRFAVKFRELLDWSASDSAPMLEDDIQNTSAVYNALGLPVKITQTGLGSIARDYDAAGRLRTLRSFSSVDHDGPPCSTHNIEYEADGMVARTVASCGTETTHLYDRQTRRHVGTRSLRVRDNKVLEEMSHVYDVVGRIVQTTRRTNVAPVWEEPVTQEFEYNHFGQITATTGRVQTDPESKQLRPYDFNTDQSDVKPGGRLIRYRESYTYDEVGNIKTVQNVPEGDHSGWTKRYTYEEASNRLTATEIGAAARAYQYDGEAGRNGCMTYISGYSALAWDFDDRLRAFSTQSVSEGKTPETTWYVYNADGNRVRKVTERSGDASSATPPARIKETRFLALGDIFSRFRGDGHETSLIMATLHVSDKTLGRAPVAVVESGSHLESFLLRYRLSEQLEVDDQANIVWYQELSPFGSVTFQTSKSDAPRAYRFASYRWDSESGLYYCGARYYASWLGRWISADPLGTADGLNLYVYVGNDPINFDDPGGTMRLFRSTTSLFSSVRRTRTDMDLTSSNGFRRNTMNFSTTKQANGAPQGNGGSQGGIITNTTGQGSRPLASSIFPSGISHFYRVMDAARGNAFEKGNDAARVASLVTRYTGDLNWQTHTTTYFANSENAAFSHTRWMSGLITMIRIGVPFDDLTGTNIYNLDSPESIERFVMVSTLRPSALPLPQTHNGHPKGRVFFL